MSGHAPVLDVHEHLEVDLSKVRTVGGFVERLAETGHETVIWRGVEAAVAGFGTAVKAVHVREQVARTLKNLDKADGIAFVGDGIDIAVRLVEEGGPEAALLNSFTVDGPGTMLVAGCGDETYQATANVMELAELARRGGRERPFFAGCVDPHRHRGRLAVFAGQLPAYLDIHIRPRAARHGRDCRCVRCIQLDAASRTTIQPLLYMEQYQG